MRSLLLLSDIAALAAPDRVLASNADCLVIDLMALDGQKNAEGQELVYRLLRTSKALPTRPQLFVRIPPIDHARAIASLDAVIGAGAEGIVLPQALGGHDVTRLDARISVEEAVHAIDHGSVKILAEAASTARGVQGLASFRGASHRLSGLIWSPERLAHDLGGISVRTPDGSLRPPIAFACGQLLIAAIAASVPAILDGTSDQTSHAYKRYDVAHADGFAAVLTNAVDEVAEIACMMARPRT